MSATAFQRMRREQAAKEQTKAPAPSEFEKKPAELTNKELMAMLDNLGIEYDKRANKAMIVELLEKAQSQPEGTDEDQSLNTGDNPEDGKAPEAEPDNGDEGAE